PLYVMLTTSLDKKAGIELLEQAIVKVQESITAAKGSLSVKMKPKAVSETDDLELAELMARVERENAEVSGDEASSDDEA
ncbi:translation initiation factor 2, alpha subunit, partial [Syncephalis pseudoplumigaleata]